MVFTRPFFISFLIFGFYGGLTWNFHEEIQRFLFKYWWLIITLFIVTYLWTRDKFLAYHQPTNLVLDIYYVPSMAIYALAVIFLIYLICVAKKVYRWEKTLRTIHF